MHTFYSNNINNDKIVLNENDSRHAIKVLRLKITEKIIVLDGMGSKYIGEIEDPHSKKTQINVIEKILFHKEIPLIVALCPTKSNDRNEWFIEKAVEIGMTDFYPIICQNSERKKLNIERLNKIAIAALKQSGRTWLPKIHEVCRYDKFLNGNLPDIRLIAHCRNTEKAPIQKKTDTKKSQLILIGPEGDFTKEEIDLAIKKGFLPIELGKNRLRTETAGIVALTLLKQFK